MAIWHAPAKNNTLRNIMRQGESARIEAKTKRDRHRDENKERK